MSTSYEERLREQLHATNPTPYAGLDPAAVIGAGQRVVRRRRIGTALVAAVAVAVVVIGSQLFSTGRPVAAPVPAQSVPTGTGSATVTVDGFRSGQHSYVVSVHSTDDKVETSVDYAEKTASGVKSMGGAVIDPTDPRITWGHGPDSPVVLGVIPSASAQNRIIFTTTSDFGGWSTDVRPIPGTGYSAFAAYFEKPLTGDNPVREALWFDASGRPVDTKARVGDVAIANGTRVWLAADGSQFGTDRSGSSTGTADISSTAGGQALGDPWTVIGLQGRCHERTHPHRRVE